MERIGVERYSEVLPLVHGVIFSTLSFQAVLLEHMEGVVWLSPQTSSGSDGAGGRLAYIANVYGMSLLCGAAPKDIDDDQRDSILSWIKQHLSGTSPTHHRSYVEWLQVYPNDWAEFLQSNFSPSAYSTNFTEENQFALCERVNYRFNMYSQPLSSLQPLPTNMELVPLTAEHFSLEGSVVPKNFWKDVETWGKNGVGFCLLVDAKPVSWSFSSGAIDNQIELGIETVKEYRGRGLAKLLCDRLVRYCVEKEIEPVWCCRRSNTASCQLAVSLGFVEIKQPTGPIPYYHLPLSPHSDVLSDHRKKL